MIRPAFQQDLKIGDLVKYTSDTLEMCEVEDSRGSSLGIGIIMSFDGDGDPVVWFTGDDCHDHPGIGSAFYTRDIEAINESW